VPANETVTVTKPLPPLKKKKKKKKPRRRKN
jgi:hypothetical protein